MEHKTTILNRQPFHGLTKAPLTYLAVPYSYNSPDKRVKELVQRFRFETSSRAAGWLLSTEGWNVFSPITHSHPIHVLYPEVRGDWDFWKVVDTEYLQISQRIVVLTLPGWRKSTGVKAEIEIANQLGLEQKFIHPTQDGEFKLTETPQEDNYTAYAVLV